MKYVARDLKHALDHARRHFPAVLITGPRQSGKTTFVHQEAGAGSEYVSFDDLLARQFALTDPNGFLDQFADHPVILDEIQYVPGLMSSIKIRIDRHRRGGRWIMTGSQQFELMRHVSESLAGRVAILELLPFGYSELARSNPFSIQDLIWHGGYPYPVLNPEAREQWLKSYIQTYVERDVRQLQNIRDLYLFEMFLGLCAAAHGQAVNHASVSRQCGISQPACKSWEGILEASYIIRRLPPYHRNFGKRLIKNPKMYFLDSAVAAWLTRQPDAGALWAGAMGGAFFEGWVVLEAYKTFAAAGKRPDLYYWRSHDGQEMDLLIDAGGRLHCVEIKKTATPTLHHAQAFSRFRKTVDANLLGEAILVCCVAKRTALPEGAVALPWSEFTGWLGDILKDAGRQ